MFCFSAQLRTQGFISIYMLPSFLCFFDDQVVPPWAMETPPHWLLGPLMGL